MAKRWLRRQGVPDFSALQAALGARNGPGHKAHEAIFYAFDLLYLDGPDLRGLATTSRLPYDDPMVAKVELGQ